MSFRIVYLHLTSANSKGQGHVFFDCEYVRNDDRNSTYYHCHQIETPIYRLSIVKISSPSNYQPNSQSLTLHFKVKLWTFKFMLLQRLNRNFTFCTLWHIEYRVQRSTFNQIVFDLYSKGQN